MPVVVGIEPSVVHAVKSKHPSARELAIEIEDTRASDGGNGDEVGCAPTMLSAFLPVLAVIGLVAACSAFYGALWGAGARARRRLARGASTIADHTIVTLTGKVRAITTLRAPLSGVDCVAFVARGKVFTGLSPNDHIPIITQEMVPFELVTSDGIVRVDVGAIEIVVSTTPLIPRNVDLEARFLVAHGYPASEVRTAGFEQVAIVEGDSVRVQGLAMIEQVAPTDAMGYRETDRRIRLVAHDAHPLTIGPAR